LLPSCGGSRSNATQLPTTADVSCWYTTWLWSGKPVLSWAPFISQSSTQDIYRCSEPIHPIKFAAVHSP